MALKKIKYNFKDLDNISVTALRIISIFNILSERPSSEDDINQNLQENIESFEYLSNDTICIYINTLRAIGCTILRPCKSNDYKYVLTSHPFKLNFSDDEIITLIEVRKHISTLGNWKLAADADILFNLISDFMNAENQKTFSSLKETTLCREVNIENILPDLNLIEKYCKQNQDILIVYDSPNSGEKDILMNAEKLTLENGSFYLWGYNYELNETSYLRLDRIKSIKKPNVPEKKRNDERLRVKYKLTGNSAFSFVPSETERILEETETEVIIEAKIINKFKFIQEVLSYGSDCTVISPENIREEIIQKLKMMLKLHHDT